MLALVFETRTNGGVTTIEHLRAKSFKNETVWEIAWPDLMEQICLGTVAALFLWTLRGG